MKTLRYLMTVCLCLGIYTISFGQTPTATETTAKFLKKESGNALTINVQGQPKNVKAVLTNDIKTVTGSKPKLKVASSMTSFLGVTFNKVSSSQMDYHFRVEKAGKSSNNSTVTFFISAGNNNFVSSAEYPSEIRNAKDYLSGLEFEVKKYELQLTIDEQGKVIEKSIKEHQNMIQDSIKLEKRLAETKQSIIDNKASRANQLIKIDDERAKLEDLKYELDVMNGEASPRVRDDREREEVRPEYRRDSRDDDRYRNDDRAERDSRYRDDEMRAKEVSQSRYEDDRRREDDRYRSEERRYEDDRYREEDRREDDRYRSEERKFDEDRYREEDRREDDRYRSEERRSDDDRYREEDRREDDRYRSEERRSDDDRYREDDRRREDDDRYREEDRRREEERRYKEEQYRELDRWYTEDMFRDDDRRFKDLRDTRDLTDREYDRYKAWKLYDQRLREEEEARRDSRYDDSLY
ncbi:MAG: hypothetical protein AAFR66_12625 [Bacteroidota bacterium]